jgi:replicative DNA helicase
MVWKNNIKAIFVDYLQLMYTDKRVESRVQEVSTITRNLKCLAKELNIPVIALSQLSREIEKRENPKPLLSDLRESGSIEQDADVVMFLWRPAEQSKVDRGQINLSVAKQREGDIADIPLYFNKAIVTYEDATHMQAAPTKNDSTPPKTSGDEEIYDD